MQLLWKPGGFERGGNTKTHGVVRGEFVVHDGLPPAFRHGIFERPRVFPVWVRFSGPGPDVTPDIDDVGFMSISIKLMGVPGPKLMDEEKFTQDMFGVSTPTFVTPDTRANAQLQLESVKNAQIFYFFNLGRSHVLDFIMQALWLKTQSSPFEAPYFSCVPYLLGDGQAMQYSVWPKSKRRTPIPRLPFRPPDDYLRDAMVAALNEGDVELDIRIQLQTDPHLMPIENNACTLARAPLTSRVGGHVAASEADIQLSGPDGVLQAAVVQPVALDARAPTARQPKSRAASNVPGAVYAAAHHERGAALRADRRRDLRVARGLRAAIPIEIVTPEAPRTLVPGIRMSPGHSPAIPCPL